MCASLHHRKNSSQKDETKAQWADSSKAYSSPKAVSGRLEIFVFPYKM